MQMSREVEIVRVAAHHRVEVSEIVCGGRVRVHHHGPYKYDHHAETGALPHQIGDLTKGVSNTLKHGPCVNEGGEQNRTNRRNDAHGVGVVGAKCEAL